jgi:Uncharacterised nucleotidyltransferase
METGSPVATDSASRFYLEALEHFDRAGIPFLVGGAYAYSRYAQIERDTKDFDIFVRPADVTRALALFEPLGYQTELTFPHWLGKIRCGPHFIDVIFASGNGVARVDDLWFEHAVPAEVLGRPMWLSPPEEMIWSKAFVQERERYDGADVIHLLRELGPTLDWARLMMRFGERWRVLFSFIVLFGFVYPDQRQQIPLWVPEELGRRFLAEGLDADNRICNGTLLSREQYLHDLERFGYRDARTEPYGRMTEAEIEIWTNAIGDNK